MWVLEGLNDRKMQRRAKRFAKTHRQELTNLFDNLHSYLLALKGDLTPQQISRGYVHDEPRGIKALDESGPGKHRKALRLYIYPETETQTLFVLAVGDKATQREDIRECVRFVEGRQRLQSPDRD